MCLVVSAFESCLLFVFRWGLMALFRIVLNSYSMAWNNFNSAQNNIYALKNIDRLDPWFFFWVPRLYVSLNWLFLDIIEVLTQCWVAFITIDLYFFNKSSLTQLSEEQPHGQISSQRCMCVMLGFMLGYTEVTLVCVPEKMTCTEYLLRRDSRATNYCG